MALALTKALQPDRTLTWKEWKVAYIEAKDALNCIGLIQRIFDVEQDRDVSPQEQRAERIIALLELADGALKPKTGRFCSQRSEYNGSDQLKIAAYEVLSERFFKPMLQSRWKYLRGLRWDSKEVLEKLVWFFRANESFRPGEEGRKLYNLYTLEKPLKGMSDTASEFFNQLMSTIWTERFLGPLRYDDNELAPNDATLQYAQSLKPAVIELLHAYAHGKLMRLIRYEGETEPNWQRFDEACLAKLKELALHTRRHTDHEIKEVASVEESLLAGSSAGLLFLACKAAQKEKKRIEEIAKAAREAEEAQKRLAALTK